MCRNPKFTKTTVFFNFLLAKGKHINDQSRTTKLSACLSAKGNVPAAGAFRAATFAREKGRSSPFSRSKSDSRERAGE